MEEKLKKSNKLEILREVLRIFLENLNVPEEEKEEILKGVEEGRLSTMLEMAKRYDVQETRRIAFYEGEKKGISIGRLQGKLEGKAEGEKFGEVKGKVALLCRQILKKFPNIESFYFEKIKKMPVEKLDELGERLFDMEDYKDLDRFLNEV